MELEAVRYEVAGRSCTGYLADGSGGRRVPGVLVAHEAAGLGDHARERARMLAELGTVAFALDLFGEVDPPLERARELVRALRADRAALCARTAGALRVLEGHPRVDAARLAAVGFCFGWTAVLELARTGAALACVVGFHPGLDEEAREGAERIRGRLLACLGADDPVITAERREAFVREMSAAGVDWQMLLLGGVGHSFTNRWIDAWGFPGFAYDAVADRRSWQAMRALLEETLGPLDGDGAHPAPPGA